MRAEYFFGFTISSLVGVTLETTFAQGYLFGILLLFLAMIVSLLGRGMHTKRGSYLVSTVLFGCAIGIFAVDVSALNRNVHVLDQYLNRTVTVRGIVLTEPDAREMNTSIVIDTKNIEIDGTTNALEKSVHILLHAPTYPVIQYGDTISVTGKISVPQNFAAAQGERAFDYRAYLAKDDIYYEIPFSKISVTGRGNGNVVLQKLYQLKQGLENNIAHVIPEPESSLAGGIVLGTKQSLGKEWMQKFRDAGLAHIVVLSGYNIAVVASVIGRAASALPLTARLGSSAIGIILFAMMVGGGATVLRATLMALVVILARALGRESEAGRVLVFVGWLMVMQNPAILFVDVSFQLSFMAALALVILAPLIEKYFMAIKSGVLREIIVTTIATQIFVAPILLYRMGTFSLVGLVANLFVLPVVPVTMLVVAIVSVVSFVPLLGPVMGYLAQLPLSYILRVVQIGSSIPFAIVKIDSFGIAALIVCYGSLAAVCTIMKRNQSPQKK